MEKTCVVRHTRTLPNGTAQITWLGTHKSESLAQTAIGKLRVQPEFCDAAEGFSILEQVYVVEHTHKWGNEDGASETKWLGVYSTEQLAQSAIKRFLQRPGFREAPEGFCISPWTVNVNHWDGGYFTTFDEGVEANRDGNEE